MSEDVEWSKDHVLAIGPYTLILLEAFDGMVNLCRGLVPQVPWVIGYGPKI
jgi:hypothetical protein